LVNRKIRFHFSIVRRGVALGKDKKKSSKAVFAVVGVLLLCLGVALCYQAGFTSGGLFSSSTPSSSLPSLALFQDTQDIVYATFPTSATISDSGCQVFQALMYYNGNGYDNFNQNLCTFTWYIDNAQVTSTLGDTTYWVYGPSGSAPSNLFSSKVTDGTHSVECDISIPSLSDEISCSCTLIVGSGSTSTLSTYAVSFASSADGSVQWLDSTLGTSGTVSGIYGSTTTVNANDALTVEAVPNIGYVFDYWSVQSTSTFTSTTNPYQTTVTSPLSIMAFFAQAGSGTVSSPAPTPAPTLVPTPTPTASSSQQVSLVVGLYGVGDVNPSVGTYYYNSNSHVAISASAVTDSGYTFSYWLLNDGTTSTTNPDPTITLDMTSSESALAVFVSNTNPNPSPTPLSTAPPNPFSTSPPNYVVATPAPSASISAALLVNMLIFAIGAILAFSGCTVLIYAVKLK
jgi:hypothetical protein